MTPASQTSLCLFLATKLLATKIQATHIPGRQKKILGKIAIYGSKEGLNLFQNPKYSILPVDDNVQISIGSNVSRIIQHPRDKMVRESESGKNCNNAPQ